MRSRRALWLSVLLTLAWGCGDDLGAESGEAGAGANADSGNVGGLDGIGSDDTTTADAVADDADASGQDGSASFDALGGDGEQGDAASADGEQGDGTAGDGVSGDATGPVCPGGKGCECDKDNPCKSGACVDDGGKSVCADPCDAGKCPTGSVCAKVDQDGNEIEVCVPDAAQLCDPCSSSSQCIGAGGPLASENACVDLGKQGAFCASACKGDDECPNGYSCKDAKDLLGKDVKQCLPDAGICECSASGIALGLTAPCKNAMVDSEGKDVTCTGQRKCTVDGLSLCSAATEVNIEVCDGVDNDCDGTADEKTCDDDDICTIDTCDGAAAKCVHVAGKDPLCCNDSKECDDAKCATLDFCNSSNTCVFKAAPQVCAVAGDCDDGNPCTLDSCATAGGCSQCVHEPQKGCCQVAADCPGGGVCSEPACEAGNCKMAARPDGTVCDDGSTCTNDEACQGGLCLAKSVTECDDSNPCTNDSCAGKTGCQYSANKAVCDDGNPCTSADRCAQGKCGSLLAVTCDDGNPCTTDSCDSGQGCVALPTTGTVTCDDGNPCTKDDLCKDGKCSSSPNECPCTVASDCTAKDDADLCNGKLTCAASGVCEVDLPTVVTCTDGGDSCSPSLCDAKTGTCGFATKADGTPCDKDGSLCTIADQCLGGVCTLGKPADCDDGSECTKDSCDPKKGCLHVDSQATKCDDGDPCTAGESCQAGLCLGGTAKGCSDGNSCTADSCEAATGKCLHDISKDGVLCDDASKCTSDDTCLAGLCTGKQKGCDDSNPCTTDHCDAKTGDCGHKPKGEGLPCGLDKVCEQGKCVLDKDCKDKADGTACDDNDACTTGDVCANGKCAAGKQKGCNDGDDCTADFCDPLTGKCGAKVAPDKTVCDDNNVCTKNDVCTSGKCAGPDALNCDDGNTCTKESCDPKAGCQSKADDTGVCDDGNACSHPDACINGACQGKEKACNDGDPCTKDSCDAKTGKCKNEKIAGCAGCTDDKHCDDGNACTKNTCEVKSGQCNAPAPLGGGACDDGDACTPKDTCKGATCAAGPPKTCNDGDPCTVDSCNKQTGQCGATAGNEGAQCTDKDPCTVGDACSSGTCGSGKPKACNDGNPCTTDSCDKATGDCKFDKIAGCTGCDSDKACDDGKDCTINTCLADKTCKTQDKAVGEKCEDGNACTVDDTCEAGACKAGKARDCDDDNACTADSCDKDSGCVSKALADGEGCDDGNACTDKDVCSAGKCQSGAKLDCDDGNSCTADSCDAGDAVNKGKGCVYTNAAKGTPCSDGVKCTDGDACDAGKCVAGKDICGGQCGNNKCDGTETCGLCPEDCGKCLGKADVWFDLQAGSPGLLTGPARDMLDSSYRQRMTAMSSEPPGTVGTVTGTVGPLGSSATYVAARESAASLRAIFRTSDVYNDASVVSALVQFRDAAGRARIKAGTKATLVIKLAGQSDVTGTCIAGSTGLCNVSAVVPAGWFEVGKDKLATLQVTSGTLQSATAKLTVHGIPNFAAAPDNGVEITLPNGPRLPGTTFKAPVWAYAKGQPLESFDIAIKFDNKVVKATGATLDKKYTGAKNVKADEVLLVAVRAAKVPDAQVTGKVHVADITFRVQNAPALTAGKVTGNINAMFNVQNIALVDKNTPMKVRSGTGTALSGDVVVADNPIRGIYAVADKSEAYNTAMLTGKAVNLPIVVRAVRTALPDASVKATCKSADDTVISGDASCNAVLDGDEKAGAAKVDMAVTHGAHKTVVPFRVWMPGPVKVLVDDAKLESVVGWLTKCDDKATYFQRTRIYAEATFKAGPMAVTGRVNHLVRLSVDNAKIGVVTGTKDGDWLRGLAAGKAAVRAMRGPSVLGSAAFEVSNDEVKVEGLDVAVATHMDGAVDPNKALGLAGEATAVATLKQQLDAEFKTADVIAWARLSDGQRQRVTEGMGLSIKSLDDAVIETLASPPRVKAMGSGKGNYASATWTVCKQPVGKGVGYVHVVLPPAIGGSVNVLQPRISWRVKDPATVAGVPVSSGVKVTLKYGDGSSKDVTLDKRTIFDDATGDPKDLFTLKVDKDKDGNPTKVTILPTGKDVGKATLTITFKQAPKIKLTVTVNVVRHEKFTIDAHPRPPYAGSDKVSKTKLMRLEKTGVWQQAVMDLRTVLTDGHVIDVSANGGTKFTAYEPGTKTETTKVLKFGGPDVDVVDKGKADVRGSFGGADSPALAMEAVDKPVLIKSLKTSFPSTFRGITKKKTQQLQVSATFEDGTVLVNALTIKGLLTFSSSDKFRASIDADTGLATLIDNHRQLVTLTAKAVTSGVTGSSQTACNLEPDVGDIDLGQSTGLPHPDVKPGQTFVMPVRVNTGSQALGSLDITVRYDPDVLRAVKGEPGSGWPGGQFDVAVNDPPGVVHIVAAAKGGSTAKGARLEAAKITFTGVKKTGKTMTLIDGFITKLLENTKAQKPIGDELKPGQTRAIVAGRGMLDPECPGGAKPADFRGNANGNCEFEVGDVSYTLFYLAQLVKKADLDPYQLAEMDADRDNDVDVADAVYLLRVLSGKFRFASIAVKTPATLQGEVVIDARMDDKLEKPVSKQTDVFLHVGFKLNKKVKWVDGTLVKNTKDGAVVKTKAIGNGVYRVRAVGFDTPEKDIGVVSIIKTTDAEAKSAPDRQVALQGSPWLSDLSPYKPMTTFDLVVGKCTTNGDCKDGNLCTVDTCKADGSCTFPLKDCDDKSPCTTDSCSLSDGKCKYKAANEGGNCSDGNACTTKDTCATGTCKGGPAPDCDDNEVCTADSCDMAAGCTHTNLTTSCDDNNACTTGDACGLAAGATPAKWTCVGGGPTDCDDNNVCTVDSCDKVKGCGHLVDTKSKHVCYTGDPKTKDVGECKTGLQVCTPDGKLDKCIGETLPTSKEKCDGVDDTCDGTTDENCQAVDFVGKFHAGGGSGAVGKYRMRTTVGASSAVGGGAAKKYVVDLGFYKWLTTLGWKGN